MAAMKKNTWMDRIIKWYCYTLASTPTFWMGLLILIVFAVWLGWFPIGLGVPAGVLAEDVTITRSNQTSYPSSAYTKYCWGCECGITYAPKAD